MADDIISKLPDVLIQQILSFLSMKEAVRTSILSKRWEFLWTSYPNLVFDLQNEEDMNFVDIALFIRQSKVHKFSIRFEGDRDNDCCEIHLRRWITDIVRLHVEDLHLDLCGRDFYDSFEFPHCLFTCASLTSFTLRFWEEFRFPPSTNLSNLSNLLLEYVYFDDAESVDNLYNGCPMLETVSLLECRFMCDCRIYAPKLYKLVVVEPCETSCLPISNVMIFAPSLKYFHLNCDQFLNSYCLYDQPSLVKAEISVDYDLSSSDESKWEGFFGRFHKLLKNLSLVKKLSLSSEALEALGNLPAEAPIFNNLSILSLNGRDTLWFDLEDNGDAYLSDQYIGLMKILQKSPCLENLRFEMGIILSTEYERTMSLVPPCYLPSLKTLEILYENNDDYTDLFMNTAQILLDRTPVLEKFILYARKNFRVSQMDKEKLINGLNELPRASKVCQFEFSDFDMKCI